MAIPSVSPEIWYQSKEVVGATTGAFVAFFLVVCNDWLRSRRRRRSHFAALRAEVEYCRSLADTYLRDQIAAPLYRLPTMAYANSFPALLSDAALSESETNRLLQFFAEVENFNRGLDQAEEARLISDPEHRKQKLSDEYSRNRLKAEHLVPVNAIATSFYAQAITVIDTRLRRFRFFA